MGKRGLRHLAVWDCETDPFKYNRKVYPFINGFFDGEIYRFFSDKPGHDSDNIEQFIEFLREADREYLIYAHNGGKFDYHFLLRYLDPKVKIIRGRISKATITLDRPGQKSIRHELRDSYLILPLPLSAHKKDEFDYTILERSARWIPKNVDLIRDYLKSDCLYLYEWIEKFTTRFGRKLTLASACFDQLEKTGYPIPQGDAWHDELMRPYYYGGRVEVIEPGSHIGTFKYFDINSAYPRAMLEDHPFGVGRDYLSQPPTDGRMHFADITAVSKGALPFRSKDGSLSFPRDDHPRRYRVTSWEINAGLETGTLDILTWHEIIAPKKVRHFREYVDLFYAEKLHGKQTGDKDLETFAKLFLNACYGKWGQDPKDFKENYITESGRAPGNPKTETELYQCFETWRPIFDDDSISIWEKDAPGDTYFNVATAASITGYVRAMLWRTICASTFPMYCDTDAILAVDFDVPEGDALGEWKNEGTMLEVHLAGKKLYAMKSIDGKWKTASKGAVLTPDAICKICAGEQITWKKESPVFSLKSGQTFLERKIKLTNKNVEIPLL